MNTIVLALVNNIFTSKHEHHHLVKAIPRGIHPLECYKYKNNRAIRIPCNEIPDAEDITSNDLQNEEYVNNRGKPVYLTEDFVNSSKYLNNRDTRGHKKYVKEKLRNIDKTGENVSKQVRRISRKLRDFSKDETNVNSEDHSSSSCSSSSDRKKQSSMNELIEKKLMGINKSLYEKFIKALRNFKKKYNDKRSYDLQRILAFIVGMENQKRQGNFQKTKEYNSNRYLKNPFEKDMKPQKLSAFSSLSKQSDLLPICEIEKASTNMGNEFQKTIEGLLSHISDTGLDNIFSQWGEINKKTKSNKKHVEKLSTDENKSLVESLNSQLGALNDNFSDLSNYSGGLGNQNKMISLLASSNEGYPLIPPIGCPFSPNNYSTSPINYSKPPANYSPSFAPTMPQVPPQLNYAASMKYPNISKFSNQSQIYPMDSQKLSPQVTNFQNITPQELLSSVYTNFNNMPPLCGKSQLC